MKKIIVILLFLILIPTAPAQWILGGTLWPNFPVGIGQQAHQSIAFGVRCLDANCSPLHGPGQRGISSEPMFNEEATVYATAGHFMPQFVPGTYTIPLAMGLRITMPYVDPGVTFNTLIGLRIHDINRGQTNYAIYTEDGPISVGDHVTIRRLAGTGNRPACLDPNGKLIVC